MRLEDGFPTLLTIAQAPNIFGNPTGDLWIKRIKLPGYTLGGPINDTSMHNDLYRTQYPKSLITVTDASLVVSFDPHAYVSVPVVMGIITDVTYEFPLGETLVKKGWVEMWDPQEFSEGNQPEANVQIVHSMQEVNAGVLEEVAPVFNAAP